MPPRLELVLTWVVLATGGTYFAWRAYRAEGHDQLLYLGVLLVGFIVGQRAIKDVLAKLRSAAGSGARQEGAGEDH